MPGYLDRVLGELGLLSLAGATVDVKLLCVQRFVRLFAYGSSTLILALYLSAVGVSDVRIGMFMTLTLAGDVFISFCLTLIADSLGRRAILVLGAGLMSVSGVIFAFTGNYWILLAAAIFGVISPSGNEIGPFRAIEESTVAQLTPAANRGDIYAWYSLLGTAGTAFGMVTCGWVVDKLQDLEGWDNVHAYRVVFGAYAVLGMVKLGLALALSTNIEAERKIPERAASDVENAPFIHGSKPKSKPANRLLGLIPDISTESRGILLKLCILFACDAFASGLAPLSWVTYFFKIKFDIDEGRLGSLFFVTSIIASISMLVASSIAKRFGNIKTMVFTHLPSAICLALIPLPSKVQFAILFLILRSCTQSMDVAPRSAFLAAVVLPNERTAVMGTINTVKTSAQSLGPLITGLLADKNMFWLSFLAAGSLKASYDLGMLAVFAGHKTFEERDTAQEQGAAEERFALRADEDSDEED